MRTPRANYLSLILAASLGSASNFRSSAQSYPVDPLNSSATGSLSGFSNWFGLGEDGRAPVAAQEDGGFANYLEPGAGAALPMPGRDRWYEDSGQTGLGEAPASSPDSAAPANAGDDGSSTAEFAAGPAASEVQAIAPGLPSVSGVASDEARGFGARPNGSNPASPSGTLVLTGDGAVTDAVTETDTNFAIDGSNLSGQPADVQKLFAGSFGDAAAAEWIKEHDAEFQYSSVDGQLYVASPDDPGGIGPEDIAQGGLGDCYLLSSMAAIAETDPAKIRQMIRRNDDGSYTVTFANGSATVDARFPAHGGGVAFAQPDISANNQSEIWPMVMEKAYAQVNGGYGAVGHGGYPADALQSLTGSNSVNIDSSRLTFATVADWYKSGVPLVVSTKSLDDPSTKNDPLYDTTQDETSGHVLVPGHAYFVRNVDSDQGTVTLGNPWGWNDSITLNSNQLMNSTMWISRAYY